jgi:streptogramin lyase
MRWAVGSPMFGLDPKGNVWSMRRNGELNKIDMSDEQLKPVTYLVPKNGGIYDMDTDSKGRTHLYIWREGKIGIFDPEKVLYEEFKTPTPMSGPRRGWIDGKDRLWAAEFYAGQILMFDPDKKELREYPLVSGTKPYTPPFAAPYSVSPDEKNGFIWTNDFNSNRLYRINIETGQPHEYMTPSNYELRNLFVDRKSSRPTVWLPSYRPPSKLVKVQMR